MTKRFQLFPACVCERPYTLPVYTAHTAKENSHTHRTPAAGPGAAPGGRGVGPCWASPSAARSSSLLFSPRARARAAHWYMWVMALGARPCCRWSSRRPSAHGRAGRRCCHRRARSAAAVAAAVVVVVVEEEAVSGARPRSSRRWALLIFLQRQHNCAYGR